MFVLGVFLYMPGKLELYFSELGLGARMSISFTSKGVVRRSMIHFNVRCRTSSCCGAQVFEPRPCAGRRYQPVAVQERLDTSVRRTARNCGAKPRLTHQVLKHSCLCMAIFSQH